MLISYGDDSSDQTKRRVFAASLVAGTVEEWGSFSSAWLARNGERPFHATDCDSDQGAFRETDHHSNKKLYADNVGLFARSSLMGAGVAISIADYREVFPFAPSEEWEYYMCLSGAIACMANIARLLIPPQTLRVTFDQNKGREYNSRKIYEFISGGESPLAGILDGGISFADHRADVGLQLADLLAREAMKELDNRLPPVARWPRQSLIELRRTKRFECVSYDREKLVEHRLKADAIHANPEKGVAYEKWRGEQKLKDSIQARLQYHIAKSA